MTDHNYVTVLPAGEDTGGVLAIAGAELTQNLQTCLPSPEPGLSCLIHVNALFLPAAAAGSLRVPNAGLQRLDLFAQAIAVTTAHGGVAQINHPNFHYAADAFLLTKLVRKGVRFIEVANESADANNAGDAKHPSTEALWDEVLTSGADVWGVATDDAHHYDDAEVLRAEHQPVFTGDRGFVMVRAPAEPGAIRAAMLRGDFYASSGVMLARAERRADGTMVVEVAPNAGESHRIQCIGNGGEIVGESSGPIGGCASPTPGRYMRAVVTDSQGRHAWLQPVRGR